MHNSSHLSRVLAMERERELLSAAEHHRLSRAAAGDGGTPPRPPKRARRVAVLVPRARLVRWARAR